MSDPTTLPLAPLPLADAIARLLAECPLGCQLTKDGEIVQAQPAKKLDLQEMVVLCQQTRTVQSRLPGGDAFEFTVRGLSSKEQALLDQLTVVPPQKTKQTAKGEVPDGYDLDNPAYQAKAIVSQRQKRALAITIGLVGAAAQLDPELQTIEQKTAWLEERFTPQLLDLIYSAIVTLTSEPLKESSFT